MYIDILAMHSYTACACAYRKADCFQEFFYFVPRSNKISSTIQILQKLYQNVNIY